MKYITVNHIKGVLMVLGVFLLLGTAGASDMNNITMGRIIIQSIVGLMLIFAGLFLPQKEEG